MKEKEKKVIRWLNEATGRDASIVDYEYSRYDAEDKNYIYEIKWREDHYVRQMIEVDKLKANHHIGICMNKNFIYLVHSNNNIYVYNITELLGSGYDFAWGMAYCPETTEFGKKTYVWKEVGYVHTDNAVATYKT